jgi:hypothetical protein
VHYEGTCFSPRPSPAAGRQERTSLTTRILYPRKLPGMAFQVSDADSYRCLHHHTKAGHVVCAYRDAAAEVEYAEGSKMEDDKSIA